MAAAVSARKYRFRKRVLTVMAVAFLAKVRPEMLAIRLSGDGGAGRSHA